MNGYFLLVFIIVVAGDNSLPGSPRKDESQNRQSTLVNQRKPEIAGAFEVDMVDALHINERPLGGETTMPMPCVLSVKGQKIRVRKLTDLQHVLTKSRNFRRIAGRFNIKGPIIFDLDSWWKDPQTNKVGNALDDDGKDSREKNEEISSACVVIEGKQPLQLIWLKAMYWRTA